MRLIDQTLEILRLTHDGNDLSPPHLSLTQAAVNGRLTEAGEVALSELHAAVKNGTYVKLWMCDVPNLTQDHEGYVYWRGQHVEHFSHDNLAAKTQAAIELAQRCLILESKGFPVNSRTALCRVLHEAPAGTPWLEAFCRYYSFFRKGDAVRIIFYRMNDEAVAIEKIDGVVYEEVYEGAYEAYHGTVSHGCVSAGCGLSYSQYVELLEQSKLTPEEIHAAIA